MYVLIDMSVADTIRIVLFSDDGQLLQETQESGNTVALLSVLDASLQQIGCGPDAITGIAVYVGVGTFTSTRIAVTVANTFVYAQQLRACTTTVMDNTDLLQIADQVRKAVPGQLISATYSGVPRIGKKT